MNLRGHKMFTRDSKKNVSLQRLSSFDIRNGVPCLCVCTQSNASWSKTKLVCESSTQHTKKKKKKPLVSSAGLHSFYLQQFGVCLCTGAEHVRPSATTTTSSAFPLQHLPSSTEDGMEMQQPTSLIVHGFFHTSFSSKPGQAV